MQVCISKQGQEMVDDRLGVGAGWEVEAYNGDVEAQQGMHWGHPPVLEVGASALRLGHVGHAVVGRDRCCAEHRRCCSAAISSFVGCDSKYAGGVQVRGGGGDCWDPLRCVLELC